MAAVSARRMRGPRLTGCEARPRRARAISARLPAPRGPDQDRDRLRARAARRAAAGPRRAPAGRAARPSKGVGQELGQRDRGRDVGHDRAAALLGGAAGDLLPALLARALERGPRGGVGAGGDHGTDLGHAELGGLLDHQLHAVALQRRQGEDERAAGDSGRGATAPGDARRSRPARVTASSMASNSRAARRRTRAPRRPRAGAGPRARGARSARAARCARRARPPGRGSGAMLTRRRPHDERGPLAVGAHCDRRPRRRRPRATSADVVAQEAGEHEVAAGAAGGGQLRRARSIRSGAVMLASTRSKAPARTPRAPSARTRCDVDVVERACSRAAGRAPRGRSRRRPRPARAEQRAAATARMPLPVPTSSTRPRRRAPARAPPARPGTAAWSRGCRCRRPGPGSTTRRRPARRAFRRPRPGRSGTRPASKARKPSRKRADPVHLRDSAALDADAGQGGERARRLGSRSPAPSGK